MAENASPSVGTPHTLLERLRSPAAAQPGDWDRFLELYTPLLVSWAKRQGFQDADAADLAQEVLINLMSRLPSYQPQPGRKFRDWLSVVLRNQCLDFVRHRQRSNLSGADHLTEVPDTWCPTQIDEAEYRQALLARLLRIVRPSFDDRTWAAFTAVALDGRPAAEVAAELGTSRNAVNLARHRVLTHLRREADGLLD